VGAVKYCLEGKLKKTVKVEWARFILFFFYLSEFVLMEMFLFCKRKNWS
jgi:hypothetical protein